MGSLLPAGLHAAPLNDLLSSRIRLGNAASGRVQGTNVAATREASEPNHAGVLGGKSVWWSWVAPQAGTATFRTAGSEFDTLLAIYTGTSITTLRQVAADDDGGELLSSQAFFAASAGREYLIAVDGVDGETGAVTLQWLLTPPCQAPPAPAGPIPADRAVDVPGLKLSWNQGIALASQVIYGADDRLEFYQVTSPPLLALWDSTVALVSRSALRDNGNQTFTLPSNTLGVDENLCMTERFRDQPNPAWCSGFLVGPDLVATAGHCLEGLQDCPDVAFVFGFRMLNSRTPVLTFPASQVYFCRGVVANRVESQGGDWAIIQLDRKVPDHRSLRIRRSGKVAASEPIFAIGHPAGLPGKLAGGARVRDNQPPAYFIANLDVYGGNSGSAVFNASTLLVEGILVRGEEDWVEIGGCQVSKRCPDDGCIGEDVTRSTEFQHIVPANPDTVVYQVLLGACGNLALVGQTAEREWTLGRLEPGTTYCWQVIAEGECGRTPGPIWSFTTARPPASRFVRGDVSADRLVNIGDPLRILFHLFSGIGLPCLSSADVDQSGQIGLPDAVSLLRYLFLDGPGPRAPFPLCGSAPVADDLGCEEFPPCS